jgi:hypothetical protein
LVEGHAQIMSNSQLDRVGVKDDRHDVLRFVAGSYLVQSGGDARLCLKKGFSIREGETRGRLLDNLPFFQPAQLFQGTSLPCPNVIVH